MEIQSFLQYLELEKRYSKHTIVSYRNDLLEFNEFILHTEGKDLPSESITPLHLRNFIVHLSEKKRSSVTINRKMSSLRSYFTFLIKNKRILTNPTIHIQSLKVPKKSINPLSESEMQLIKNSLHPKNEQWDEYRDFLIFEMLYQCGLRRIELLQLQDKDIDFYKKEITVVGKRNKERRIPISDTLIQYLQTYLHLKNEVFPYGEYLILNNKGNQMQERRLYQWVKEYLDGITTKEKRSPHALRHAFASHILRNGAEINAVKELLGHSSLAATQVYTHQDIESLKKVFNKAHPRGHKN